MDWQILVAFAVPVLGFFGALLTSNRDPGSYRRLKHSVDALVAVPEESDAHDALEQLVLTQATALKKREERRINYANLALAIIISLLAGFGAFWLWSWSAAVWGRGEAWFVLPISFLVGIFILLVVAAAFGNIFNPPSDRKGSTKEGAPPAK